MGNGLSQSHMDKLYAKVGAARRRTFLLCSAAALSLALSSEQAQAVEDNSADMASTGDEIIVTAQRRAERLEDVPMAISAISSDAIENSGVTGIHEINRLAAGVSVGFGGPFSAPAIRGVTTLASGNSIENNVAIYFDGFYEPNPLILNQDLINLASIEVLKGPQSALYGRNATGGVILVNTMEPSETFTGKVEATYARFNDRRLSAYVSGPIDDVARFSVAGYYRKQDGYLKLAPNDNPGAPAPSGKHAAPIDQQSIRTKLELDLAPDLTATVGYNYLYSEDSRTLLFTPFDHRTSPPPQLPAENEYSFYKYNYETRSSVSMHQGTLKLAYTGGFGEITSRTSYVTSRAHNDYDFDGSYQDFTSAVGLFEQDTFQQAIDASITSLDRTDILLGGLYYKDDLNTGGPEHITYFGANRALSNRNVADISTEALGLYLDLTYRLTEKLSINGGVRYNYEKKNGSIFLIDSADTVANAIRDASGSFNKLTARASVRYEVMPRSNVYATFSQGFRPGTFQLAAPAPGVPWPLSKAETINAYELGFKTAQRRLRLDVSAFYYDYRNLTVSVTVPNPNGAGVVALLGNAPKAEVYGIDGELSLTPMDGLTISAGAAWLHGRYKNFPNAVGTGLNASGTNVGGQQQDWSGQQMVRTPNFSGNLGIDYETSLADGTIRFATNGTYSSSYVPNNPSLYGPMAAPELQDRQRFRQGAYFLLNAQVSWTDPSDSFTLTVFGTNLTDKAYRLTYNGGFFGDYGTNAPPLSYGIKGSYAF